MKISVITTVYNGLKYLPETINSISKQDIIDNVEHIIVDDGSTDGTLEYLSELSLPHLKVISLPRSGRGVALNKGVEVSQGQYIAILDADDISSPFRLKIQSDFLDSHKSVSLVCSECTVNHDILLLDEPVDIISEIIKPKAFSKKNAICHSSVMVRKKDLENVCGYNEKRTELFDYDLWVRLLERKCIFSKLKYNLIYKRIHKDQSFENKKRYKYLWGSLIFKYKILSYHGGSVVEYIFPLLIFAYGFLPVVIRKRLMDRWH